MSGSIVVLMDWFFNEFKLLTVTGSRVEVNPEIQTCFQFGGKVEVLERPDEPSTSLGHRRAVPHERAAGRARTGAPDLG
eukprot:COSAG01_NODE_1270_length_10961_cov_34.289423_12_plen_79_part_00